MRQQQTSLFNLRHYRLNQITNHFFALSHSSLLAFTALTFFLFSTINPILGQVQCRPDIYDFDQAERCELRNLMVTYLNLNSQAAVFEHQSPTPPFTTSSIHCYDEVFLSWHRDYIRDMENWLLTQNGGPKYVPLPAWDPATSIPCEFFNNTCGSCSGTSIASGFGNMNNQNPSGYDFSRFLNSTTLCSYNAGSENPPGPKPTRVGTAIDNFALDLESEHNSVHVSVGGVMGTFTSPAAAIFWLWHAYVDDIYKKYQCDCQGATDKDVYIADSVEDIGNEANNETSSFYQSPEIWVRQTQDVIGPDGRYIQEDNPLRHENPEAGQTNYIYVRIKNIACEATLASDIDLRVYYSKASTGLSWPTTWDNYVVGGILYGDEITLSPLSIPPILPGESYTAEIPWSPPDPAIFGESNSHICLLGRLVSTADPMAFVETTSINSNTRNNNNIAWKNTQVYNINPFVMVASSIPVTFQITQLPQLDNPIRLDFLNLDMLNFDRVQLTVQPNIFERHFANATADGMEQYQDQNGNIVFEIFNNNSRVEGIFLSPGETIPVDLTFELKCSPEGGFPCAEFGDIFDFNVEQFAQGPFGDEFVGGNNYEIRITPTPESQCGDFIDVEFIKDASCENNSDGAIGLNIQASEPYSIYWSNGARVQEISELLPGNYSVTIMDAEGCINTETFQIKSLTDLRVNFDTVSPSCFQPNGIIKAEAEGGNPPYSYSWSANADGPVLEGVGFGQYSLTVSDGQQCKTVGLVNVGGIPPVGAFIVPTNSSYENTADGKVECIPNNGTAPYSIVWNTGETGNILNNVLPGNYSYTITDANGCTFSESAEVGFDRICISYLEVNDEPIEAGIYLASDKLISEGKVMAGDNVKFGANGYILLRNEFEVEWGGQIEVNPEGCSTSNAVDQVDKKQNNNKNRN